MKRYEDITITSLEEYLSALKIPSSTYQVTSNSMICPVWRGQSDKSWKIESSACRNTRYFKNEHNYYLEMLRMMPEEFRSLSELDCLEKMQHYGIPTRLLDFSTNPLVALYFACCDNPKTDGVVFEVHGSQFYRENSAYSKIVLEYALSFPKTTFNIDEFIKAIEEKYTDIEEHFLHREEIVNILTMPVGLLPSYNNPRVANQSGVFYMCGLDIKNISDEIIDFKIKKYSDVREFSPFSRTITIPKDYKASLLEVLSVCGFSAKTMFPELPGVAEYILKTTNKKYIYLD